ncbi:MAG: large conductance mechanosensitive channel protein MscL [Proteobacteria bacterium]|nr:large conductance mechanosensitive channel protein MscL [Pseudomonadota bacterium]
MVSEFKEFIAKGNVMDLAVGVIIGAAFGKIVTSLTDDLIMPIVGKVFGGLDFSAKYLVLSGDVAPGTPLDAARKAGANVLAYGSFISAVINFLIMAWVIFMLVKAVNRAMPPAPAAPAGPSEVDLLTEIRDSLKR